MGQDAAAEAPMVADALDLAERLVAAAEAGRVDLGDLGRRARRLLASTTVPESTDASTRGLLAASPRQALGRQQTLGWGAVAQ